MTDGSRAHKAGQAGEAAVATFLETYCRYTHIPCVDFAFQCSKRVYASQCKSDMTILDVYGRRRTLDFALAATDKWPAGMAIEVKWQVSSGSVDEKFPFEVMSIALSPVPYVIVADGGGASAEAIAWLREQTIEPNIIGVFTLGEFGRFARDHL